MTVLFTRQKSHTIMQTRANSAHYTHWWLCCNMAASSCTDAQLVNCFEHLWESWWTSSTNNCCWCLTWPVANQAVLPLVSLLAYSSYSCQWWAVSVVSQWPFSPLLSLFLPRLWCFLPLFVWGSGSPAAEPDSAGARWSVAEPSHSLTQFTHYTVHILTHHVIMSPLKQSLRLLKAFLVGSQFS